jgi:hypothetical protein
MEMEMTRTAEQIELEERDAERLLIAAKCARRRLPRVEVFDWRWQRPQRPIATPTLAEFAKAAMAEADNL